MTIATGTAGGGRADKLRLDVAAAKAARDVARRELDELSLAGWSAAVIEAARCEERGVYDKAMSLAFAEFSKGAWGDA